MTQNPTAFCGAAADQLMRRMLNSIDRLQAAVTADGAALARLQQERQTEMAAAERAAREQSSREISSAFELSDPNPLGSRLRVQLDRYSHISLKHANRDKPPYSLAEAIQEWRALSQQATSRVNDFRREYAAWNAKVFKRQKSIPQIPEALWQQLDRLDLIHRAIPSLTQAHVAEAIREVTNASDIAIEAEREKQRVAQARLAAETNAAIRAVKAELDLAAAPWSDHRWDIPRPAESVQHMLRLGDLLPGLPPSLGIEPIPALTAFPLVNGLAIGADVAQRGAAIGLMKSLMLRLFAAIPPGQLNVKAVDPVSLGQSTAEFRHFSEYDGQLMDEKTWTSEREIEKLMDEMAEHLEVVISHYLKGQFDTIDEYNQQAGEVAQPYRVLTVLDYPTGFTEKAQRQLLSLIENGPRCGVYTILHYDTGAAPRAEYSLGVHIDRLIHSMQKVTFGAGTGSRSGSASIGRTVLAGGGELRVGDRFESTVITLSDDGDGAHLTLPSGGKGFMHITSMKGLNGGHVVQNVGSVLSPGQSVAVRVTGITSGVWLAPDAAATVQTGVAATGALALVELGDPIGAVKLEMLADAAPPIAFDSNGHPETTFARLIPAVGAQVKKAQEQPPSVTLDSLLPVLARGRTGALPEFEAGAATFSTDPSSWWHATTANMAIALIGRAGAQGVASMFFSSTKVAGGALMVGLPRSGKTTSLHAMILTLSMLYSPQELELYLIDAKHGVEFNVYRNLPHARMVSIHSEREFSGAVLKSLQKEIQVRAEMMKTEAPGISNITEYRQKTGKELSRIVVVIDEFHELFEQQDEVSSQAFDAFSDIVRMGPFSGVHIVLASQTLSSMPAMDRQTLTLLPQRVAFMCNDYDADIVMGDENQAARQLTKTGAGVFNPNRGAVPDNVLFQGLFVPPDERSAVLNRLGERASSIGWTRLPRVFDGHAVVRRPDPATLPTPGSKFRIPVGEPYNLDDAEDLALSRTRASNLLVIGDQDEEDNRDRAARSVLHSVLLAAHSQKVQTTVIDFLGDEETNGALTIMDVAEATGARYVRSRSLDAVLAEFAEAVLTRTQAEEYKAPPKLLMLFGVQRALSLSPFDKYEADPDNPSAAQFLAAIISDGPEVGVHVVVDVDSARSLELRLGTDIVGEFSHRIAGSSADQQDRTLVVGGYGDVGVVSFGQLLIGEPLRGRSKRVRGYEALSEAPSGN